mgnify:FL=1
MPTYDYRCDLNGITVEVRHGMDQVISTWGALSNQAGLETGETPADASVRKLITGGNVIRSENLGSGQTPPCENGGPCCGANRCGF